MPIARIHIDTMYNCISVNTEIKGAPTFMKCEPMRNRPLKVIGEFPELV